MPATTTTASTLIKPVVDDTPTVVKFTNRQLLAVLKAAGMRDMQASGDTNFRWKVNRAAGNTSAEVYSEGQGLPTSGNQTWAEAALAWVYHRVVVQITGHLADAIGSHYLSDGALGILAGELQYGIDDLTDLMNNTFLGSTNNGLDIAIDSAGTYAGQARATITDWQSSETDIAGVLTVASLTAMYEAIVDNDRGGQPSALLMPWNQVTNYAALAGVENGTAAARLVRYIAQPGKAPSIDVGFDPGLTFMGLPIFGVHDMTDTTIYLIGDAARGAWEFVNIRPITQKILSLNDDSEARIQVSTGGTLVCRNPRTQAKITTVTA